MTQTTTTTTRNARIRTTNKLVAALKAAHPGVDVYFNKLPRYNNPDQRPFLRILCPTVEAAQDAERRLVEAGMANATSFGVPMGSPAGKRGFTRRVVGYVDC